MNTQKKPVLLRGYVCALFSLLFFPVPLGIAGAIFGVINITRGHEGHGTAQVISSLICGGIGAFVGVMVWSSGGW